MYNQSPWNFILLFMGLYSLGVYRFGPVQIWIVHFWIVQIWSCTDLALYRFGLYRFKCTVLGYPDLDVQIGPGYRPKSDYEDKGKRQIIYCSKEWARIFTSKERNHGNFQLSQFKRMNILILQKPEAIKRIPFNFLHGGRSFNFVLQIGTVRPV